MKTLVGTKTLGKLSKKLTNDIPTLKSKIIINKIGWGITISRMVKALVLVKYGTKISSHNDAKSYECRCNSWFFKFSIV
jgi:hypothetical protein